MGVKAQRRLYVLLGFLVSNYFRFAVSFEAESFDVKVDSYTRENQWDIGKLLDRMNTCPSVKLHSLAASDSKKKSVALSRFEVFVWFSMMTTVHLLRTLSAFLYSLLVRAGDVELNPGPPPRPETTASPSHDENKPSSSSTPNLDTDQLAPISSEPVHGHTKPLEATSPNLSANFPVDRKVANTSVNEATPSVDLQPFPTEKEDSRDVVSGLSSAIKHPIPQVELQKDKSVMIGPEITMHKKGSDSEIGIGAGSVTTEAVQPTAGDDEKTNIVAISPPRQARSMKRLSLQRTASPKSTASDTCKKSRKQVLQQQEDVMHLLEVVLDKEPVDEATVAKRLLDFFIGANKLYRSGEKCPVCPICLKLKKERGGQRKSHVIPKSVLHHYWEIHSTSEQRDYILDFSRDERLAAGSLTYQLLCEKCETYYSKFEEHLLCEYLYLAAQEDTTKDIIITHKDKNASSWLRYILANIIFRGILTNIDLDERFQQQNIIDEVHYLWNFCRGTLEAASEQSTLPNLKLFLLPNKPFCSNIDDFMYPFEMLLRMPRCTELIQQKEEGTFFYTKFDCFHIVLPLCETSKTYFETFNCGLVSEDHNLCLRWSIQPKTDIIRHDKLIEFSYSPKDTSLRDHFPEVLLSWCTSLYEKFASRVYNHPRLKRSFLAGIERYHGAKYIGFNVEERLQQAEVLKSRISDKRLSQTITFEDQCKIHKKENIKVYVLNASRQSPLRRRACEREELQRMKDEHNTEIANMNAALAEAKRELGDTRQALANTRDELENKEQDHKAYKATSKRQIATLQSKVADLSDKISYQNEKMAVAMSDLWSSRKELDSAKEISQRQSQSHVENFRRIKFLYTSSLRHANREQNEWIIDTLRKTIDDMATDFEYLKEVTQGSCLQQTYEELYDECKKLLTLTPPNSPISADHVEQLK